MSELSSVKHVVAQVGGNDDALLDVVFLHGLGGSPTETWTTPSGVFWPKEWLAHQLPKARIFTVGYPATMLTVGSAANRMKISDHADTILALLEAEGVGDKPIVFVCHSLGGLVAKAMLQAADNREFGASIVRNTKAIVFYGTPHTGAELARFAKIFPLVSTVASQLEPGSEYLKLLNDVFRSIAKRQAIEIKSYVESIPYLGAIIVDEHSARCAEWETRIVLSEDHLSICKPTVKGNPQYKTLHPFIAKLVPSADSSHQARKGVRGVIMNTEVTGSAIEKIRYSLECGQPIPTKYFYETDWCAENWCDFFEERAVDEVSELRELLRSGDFSRSVMANLRGMATYISIGVGDGRKDKEVIECLWTAAHRPIDYRPLDVSLPLLKRACKKALALGSRRMEISASFLCGELGDIARCADDLGEGPRLFSILGNTIGNLMNDAAALSIVASVMAPNDLLLLDVRSCSSFDEFKESDGDHSKASRFSFGPLQTLGWDFNLDNFDLNEINTYSNITGSRTAVVVYSTEGRGQVSLDHINFYDASSIEAYFRKIGLSTKVKHIKGGSIYFLLMRS